MISSILAISFWGLKPSIDFTGGSLLSISFDGASPTVIEVNNVLVEIGIENSSTRPSSEGFIIRLPEITQNEKNSIIEKLSFDGKYFPIEKTFSTIGPILGKEAIQKSWISIILVLLAIILFITFAFRKVSKTVSSWVYGLITILALLHDVLIPTGVFAILGYLAGVEVDTLFVTALLVILGFSVHDTIVVFDRVRENLHRNEDFKEKKDFETIVGESINQTFIRSINTSVTTLLAIFILYLLGPETIKSFTLAMIIGIAAGTYSSIFFASPLLVTINNWKNKDK
ncbi:MAG: protein translocase subunit SecF [Candidatus Zambryskibacteria bacterium]|nr:protein translocase subunit SecF [Candidatus Zambryskibacteria bacterium]